MNLSILSPSLLIRHLQILRCVLVNEIANFGPAAGVVRTRLTLRPILERTSYSYTLNPLLHSVVVLWPTHVIVSGSVILKPEGWPCVELQKGLEWDCVGGTSCVPPCLAPLLYPTVYLSSAMVYFPVVHHSALIMCYGIVLFAESEKGTPARFFLQYTLYWHLIWNGSAIAAFKDATMQTCSIAVFR